MTNLHLAHLSDLHFGYPTYNLTQFLSKRWIGNLNLLLFRKRFFQSTHLLSLPHLFTQLNIENIFFTGDFTSTSLKEEFLLAKKFLNKFPQPFFVLPGNHDVYTKRSEQEKIFYDYFPVLKGELGFNLYEDRIFCAPIKKGWWWISLDCALATPPFHAYGVFSPLMGDKLEQLLLHIPKSDRIIMGNHFPLFSSKDSRHDLKNAAQLRHILKNESRVKLYLHGHIHKSYIINKMQDGYPLVLNSGSSALIENGGFYFIHIQDSHCHIDHYFYKKERGWHPEKKYDYFF